MFIAFRRTFLAVLLVSVALLVARVFTSFAFVAGAVGHTLSAGYGPGAVEHLMSDLTRGVQVVTSNLSPHTGYRRTLSVLDIPAELEARRQSRGTERLPGGSLVITIADTTR